MSTTATGFNLKQYLIDNVQMMTSTYVADLGFIPEDKQGAVPMGKARTAVEFTAECAGFNFFVAGLCAKGKASSMTPDERKAYMESIDTGAKAIEALNKSALVLTSAIAELSDDDLMQEVTMPWGSVVPLYKAISMSYGHMMYHCGQVNYIQSLFGDDANHWGG